MAVCDTALVTYEEAKLHLRLTNDDNQALIETFINAVSRNFERYCDTVFIKRSWTERHSGGVGYALGGRQRLHLKAPVEIIGSITDDAGRSVPAADYVILKEEGVREVVIPKHGEGFDL
jgi:hypothetical protein